MQGRREGEAGRETSKLLCCFEQMVGSACTRDASWEVCLSPGHPGVYVVLLPELAEPVATSRDCCLACTPRLMTMARGTTSNTQKAVTALFMLPWTSVSIKEGFVLP